MDNRVVGRAVAEVEYFVAAETGLAVEAAAHFLAELLLVVLCLLAAEMDLLEIETLVALESTVC